jgi:hypothetical protein
MKFSRGDFIKLNWQPIFAVCLLVTASEFIVRGPGRAEDSSFDWVSPYLSTKAWVQGGNPFDYRLLEQLQQNEGDVPQFVPLQRYFPSVYPPTVYVILAPLSPLSWYQARQVFLIINVIAAILTFSVLAILTGFKLTEWRFYLFWCLALGFAPFHTGIAHGNLIIISAACVTLSMWAAASTKNTYAGGMLAVAIALKPQIGAVIWLAYAFQKRWRICLVTVVIWLLIAGIAVWQLDRNKIDWLQGWMSNIGEFQVVGSANDPTSANPLRHDLINLQRLIHALVGLSRRKVNALTIGLTSCLMAGYIFLMLKQKRSETDDLLLATSVLAVVGLLPVYHRFYDATLLLLPLTWSLMAWQSHLQVLARLTLILILPFSFPIPAMLYQLIVRNYIVHDWAETWWWNALLMSHQVWLLIFLALSLLYALKRTNKHSLEVVAESSC